MVAALLDRDAQGTWPPASSADGSTDEIPVVDLTSHHEGPSPARKGWTSRPSRNLRKISTSQRRQVARLIKGGSSMNRRNKIAAIGAAVTLIGGGAAFATWSAGGTGPSQARALTAQSITVTSATATADLYPGFSNGDVSFSLTNPNPYPVTLTAMTPGAVTSSNPSACPATNVTVSPATGLSLAVGAGATATDQTIADVVAMATSAPDGCQGVTFTISLSLSGAQS